MTPDLFKVILDGGNFGIICFVIGWVCFRLFPMYERQKALQQQHELALHRECREERAADSARNVALVERLIAQFEVWRKEDLMQRHKHAELVQTAIADVYAKKGNLAG